MTTYYHWLGADASKMARFETVECDCDCGTPCPQGRTGSETKCRIVKRIKYRPA